MRMKIGETNPNKLIILLLKLFLSLIALLNYHFNFFAHHTKFMILAIDSKLIIIVLIVLYYKNRLGRSIIYYLVHCNRYTYNHCKFY